MKISVIHPSRNRPEQAYTTIKKWTQNADGQIEYILCLDKDDFEKYVPFYQEFYKRYDYNFWVPEPLLHKNAIEAINYGATQVSGDLLIVISDDFDCPEHWDTLLLKEIEGKSDFLLKTDDGLQRTLVTLPILDRTYYNRFNYIYHPDYQHMHADEEMTIVAIMLGHYIKSELKFIHNHYSTGRTLKDSINDRANATWTHGQRTLDRRAMNDFGIENPLCKREQIIWR